VIFEAHGNVTVSLELVRPGNWYMIVDGNKLSIVTSGFRHYVKEILPAQGYYAAKIGI
jgi:hypothetical protein